MSTSLRHFLESLPATRDRAAAAARQLEVFVEAVSRAAPRTNLVGDADPEFIRQILVLGSLQLLRAAIPTGRLVDVGSGAGFPGIPLAIALPHLDVTLVEPRTKRVAFLREVLPQLGLTRISLIKREAEKLVPGDFDWAVARALRPPAEWLALGAQLVKPGGRVALYATTAHWEAAQVPAELTTESQVADETASTRCVVVLRRTQD